MDLILLQNHIDRFEENAQFQDDKDILQTLALLSIAESLQHILLHISKDSTNTND